MSFKTRIRSMHSNVLAGQTTVEVEILEDLGVATRIKDRLSIELKGKYTGIDETLIAAVDAYVAEHAVALGLPVAEPEPEAPADTGQPADAA